jgi:16S rRNA (cytosine1402-N4)-methyltransferase
LGQTNPVQASHHQPVMLEESLEGLQIRPDGTYVDLTFGRGGHSRGLLARLGPSGRLVAFDRDPDAVAAGQVIQDPRFTLCHAPFSSLAPTLDKLGLSQVDGLLADLGVSSPQLDEADRGFSFMRDGPLDMRMDPTMGPTAAQWLALVDPDDLE